MSLRISVLEEVKKSQSRSKSLNSSKTLTRSTSPTSFYVRSHHISRRAKSPFRKYEQCIIEANKQKVTTTKENNLTSLNQTTCKILLPSTIKRTLFSRKIPVDPNEIKNRSNFKQVNNFEDLVMACVDSGPVITPNDLICYKKKYLVNLSDSNWNLCTNNESYNDNSASSSNNIYNYQCKNTLTTRNNYVINDNCFAKSQIQVASLSGDRLNYAESIKKVHFNNKIESFDKKCEKNEIINQQPPLGVPEYSHKDDENNKSFINDSSKQIDLCLDNDNDPFDDINVNPDTAEQFINLLIAEDKMLRKKIAEGDVDEKCLKRLERLTELRQKYIKFKEEKDKSELTLKIESEAINKIENENLYNDQKQEEKQFSEKPKVSKSKYVPKSEGVLYAKSLSDLSFSNELKHHPLIQENSYLVSTLH